VTVLRIAGWSLAYLAATVVLVGLCGVPGLLVWLFTVCAVGCAPDAALRLVSSVQWRHVVQAWRWLDRR
jgi:hypothetical protein